MTTIYYLVGLLNSHIRKWTQAQAHTHAHTHKVRHQKNTIPQANIEKLAHQLHTEIAEHSTYMAINRDQHILFYTIGDYRLKESEKQTNTPIYLLMVFVTIKSSRQ